MRINRRTFRYLMAPIVILVLAVPLGLFAYGHVSAASACGKSYAHCVPVNENWTATSSVRDPGVGCCVQVDYHLGGHVGYNVIRPRGGYLWKNQTILNPVLTAQVYICQPGYCIKEGRLSYLVMDQLWDGYSCTFNPTFSFGAPWSLALSFWPNCANRTVAEYPYNSHGGGSFFKEDNELVPTKITNYGPVASPGDGPCYGINITSTFNEGTIQVPFASTSTRKVCLPS